MVRKLKPKALKQTLSPTDQAQLILQALLGLLAWLLLLVKQRHPAATDLCSAAYSIQNCVSDKLHNFNRVEESEKDFPLTLWRHKSSDEAVQISWSGG